MAKQYIPGIGGLLTEPNPVDSPSNTLSEAENVIIEQTGKVRARHGFNIDDDNRYIYYNTSNNGKNHYNPNITYTDYTTNPAKSACLISKTSTASCVITITNHGLKVNDQIKFSTTGQLPDTGSGSARLTANTTYTVKSVIDINSFTIQNGAVAVDIGTAEQYGTHYAIYRRRLGYVDINTVDYSIDPYTIINSEVSNVLMNSFYDNDDIYFKFIEFKNSNKEILTGVFVKQNRNEYAIEKIETDSKYLVNRPVNDPVLRYYQISKDGTKVINNGLIEYNNVDEIFKTDKSLYLQTENGLVESNIDDIFRPTNDRFFTIKWPKYIKLKHRLTQSDVFSNWFRAGTKIGVRYVFYREMGYDQQEGDIYFSEPSEIYEIINDDKNGFPQIYFDFSGFINNLDDYKNLNEFTQCNNGRKFGIIMYRTKADKISDNEGNYNPLPVEFHQCTDKIPFDTLLAAEIQSIDINNGVSFINHRDLSIYRPIDTRGEFNENDILTYIPNNKSNTGLTLNSGYIYSEKNIRFNEEKFDINDIIPGQLKVSKKIKQSLDCLIQTTGQGSFTELDTLSSTNQQLIKYDSSNTSIRRYYGCNYKNTDKHSEFVNTIVIGLEQLFENALFTSGTVGVELWEYDEKTSSEYTAFPYPKLTNKLGSSEISLTNYPNNITYNKNEAYSSDLSKIFIVPNTSATFLAIIGTSNLTSTTFYDGTNILYSANNILTIIINNTTYTVTFSASGTGTTLTPTQIATAINAVINSVGTASIDYINSTLNAVLRIRANTGSIGLGTGSANTSLKFSNYQLTAKDTWHFVFNLGKNIELRSNKSYMVVLVFDSLYQTTSVTATITRGAQFYYNTYLNSSSQKYDVMRFSWQDLGSPTYLSTIFTETTSGSLRRYAFGFARVEPIYKYELTAINNITDQSSTPVTLSSGSILTQAKGSLWKDRYLIKSFNIDFWQTDSVLDSYPLIYTDSSQDADFNDISPKSKSIISFKDFYIYAGITEPLVATIYPVEQPYVSQIKFGLKTLNTLAQNATENANRNEFVTQNRTLPDISIDSSNNGEVYLDSAIFPNKLVNVKVLNSVDLKTSGYNILSQNDAIPIEVINLSTTSLTPSDVATQFEVEATIFEKPYLTLRLTAKSGKVDIISVQVEPIYNRRGYYTKNNELKEPDTKHLQFNLSLNEGNTFKSTTTGGQTTTIERSGLTVHNVPGNGIYQTQPAGKHKQANYNITDSNALNKIYFTNNLLTLRAIDSFDINKFTSPGILLIQTAPNVSNISDVAVFNYQVVRVASSNANYYEFVDATLVYVTKDGIPQDIAVARTGTIIPISDVSLYFLSGTTIQNSSLYSYTTPNLTRIFAQKNTDNTYKVKEDYNFNIDTSKYINQPSFTFITHNKKTYNQVGKFDTTGNYLFSGNNEIFGLYEFGVQLVEKFNKEFAKLGINASCRPVDSNTAVGGVEIIYPEGIKIEMMNGKYDVINGVQSITYPGKHVFIPDISKQKFITLAEYSPSQYRSNIAYVSRRKVPEIVTSTSDIVIGSNDKEYIGYAKQTDDLYIFREDGIFRIVDNGSKNFPLYDIPNIGVTQFSTNVICQAAGSIQEINDEIIFLSQFGFTSIQNGGIEYNISQSIKSDILKLLETSPKNRIRSFVNESKNLYYCTLINEIDSNLDVKSGTYIFNTMTRQWSFMDNEILDGLEDYDHRNLVAYRQKSINATGGGTSQFRYDNLSDNNGAYYADWYEFSYPLTISNLYNNFYVISREQHTSGISTNQLDQYDFITRRFDLGYNPATNSRGKLFFAPISGYDSTSSGADQFKEIIWKTNGFTVVTRLTGRDRFYTPNSPTAPYNYINPADRGSIFSYFLPKVDNLNLPIYGIKTSTTFETPSKHVIFDSFVQYFYNRDVKIKFYLATTTQNFTGNTEIQSIKLKKISYRMGNTTIADPTAITQMFIEFEFLDTKPSFWNSTVVPQNVWEGSNWNTYDNFGYVIDGFEILAGVPVKITFNPESNRQPDSNKLFQEFMIHTETNNKAMSMAFKTDSRVNYTSDRKFAYDSTANNRNVFRTYIPSTAARGRYLIRQVKHNLPLENLIITGQTIVMRDTGSPRVQKDED